MSILLWFVVVNILKKIVTDLVAIAFFFPQVGKKYPLWWNFKLWSHFGKIMLHACSVFNKLLETIYSLNLFYYCMNYLIEAISSDGLQ